MTTQPSRVRGETRKSVFGQGKQRLSTKQAVYHMGLSIRTLEGLRSRNKGPLAYKLGRNWFYFVDDIEQWARGHARGEGS
jgi:hypothetical protein